MTNSDASNAEKTSRLINFAYLSFIIAWSLGVVFLLAKQFILKTLLVSSSPGTVFINDFIHFYCAGQLILQGEAKRIYDPQVQLIFMDRLIAPLHAAQVFYIQYVPFVFLLSVPIALLPLEPAYCAWTAFSIFCILASGLLLHKFLPRFSGPQVSIIFLAMFATLANFECLQLGQLGCFLLLLLTVYLIALVRPASIGQTRILDIAGGACLALSSMKPHYALLMAIPALLQKRWGIIFCAAMTELFLLGASGLILGWENIINYPHVVLEADTNPQYGGVHPEHMVSIRGVFCRFLSDHVALKASMFVYLAGALLIALNKKNRLADQKNIELLFSVTLVMTLVLSPHTNLYDCVLLVLPAYLLLPGVNLTEICRTQPLPAKCTQIILVFYPLFSAIMFVLWEYVPFVSQNPLPFFFTHLLLLISLLAMQKNQSIPGL